MIALVQVLSGALGVIVVALVFWDDRPPWILYLPVMWLFSWVGVKLYARWRYGNGVTVSPSRPQ
jgi:hypothetical protein